MMIRQLFLLFVCLTSSYLLDAQDDSEPKTLLGTVDKVSGFGGFNMEFGSLNNDFVVFSGGGGGILLNRSIFLGGYGMGMSNEFKTEINGVDTRLNFGHGGFWLGYDAMPARMIHLTTSVKLGWGGVRFQPNFVGFPPSGIFDDSFSENVFVIQPSAGAELNLTKFFKIALTGNYRLVQGLNTDGLDKNLLNGFSTELAFKFGWFD